MLYYQVLLVYLIPPIGICLALYYPLLGRRDGIKLIWLCLMATLWTTPWDNWILSQSGWSYPEGSILGKIFLVPVEEHAFFILQPIFLILLHCLFTHPRLLPFDCDLTPGMSSAQLVAKSPEKGKGKAVGPRKVVQTLPRRKLASVFWLALFGLGAALVTEAHSSNGLGLGLGKKVLYLGWILAWITPVIGFLTWLGEKMTRHDLVAWAAGSMYLCMVDTIAIRSGSWSISPSTTLSIEPIRGLPLEEAIFFFLTSYLIILSCSLISHLHSLLLLSTTLPPCPPRNPFKHIALLANVGLHPPPIDIQILKGLTHAETTLKKGSRSFSVAKLAFGREMRIGLVAIYAWCRVTDNLIDDIDGTASETEVIEAKKRQTLNAIRNHLEGSFDVPALSPTELDGVLDTIPNLEHSHRSSFRLFTALIPRLVPVGPFLELCRGYETDMQYVPSAPSPSDPPPPSRSVRSPLRAKALEDPDFQISQHLPILVKEDLLAYADNVAGSIASAICYLSWSLLEDISDAALALRPVGAHLDGPCADSKPSTKPVNGHIGSDLNWRKAVVSSAREMGRALQLVNIARDVAKDAMINRIYIPLSSFPHAPALLDILFPDPDDPPSYAVYSIPLLDQADEMRARSFGAIERLPRTARGGTRSMVASYFEIGRAIRAKGGEVDERGIKVSRVDRAVAAARAMWLGSGGS